jgi:putative redox protein
MTLLAQWTADSGSTEAHIVGGTARWRADLESAAGGNGEAPSPHDLLDSALAACTVLTLQVYAKRKGYPLTMARAEVTHEEDRTDYKLTRRLTLEGTLDDAQRQDLLRVANACPIHKALHKRFAIETTLSS